MALKHDSHDQSDVVIYSLRKWFQNQLASSHGIYMTSLANI